MVSTNEREIIDDIRKDLKSRNRSVRALACKSLSKFKNQAAAFLLVNMLSDRDPDVRFHASESLLKIGENSVSSVIAALGHDEWIVRRQAFELMKKMAQSSSSTLQTLKKALNSEDLNVKFWTVKLLCELGDPDIVPHVKKIFKNGKIEEKVSIINAVSGEKLDSEIKDLIINGLSDAAWRVRKASADALTKSGIAIAGEIVEKLSSKNIDIYYWATRILGSLKAECAVEPLIKILREGDEERSEFAVAALGEIANQRASRSLIDLLDSDSWTLRKTASEALVNIGEPVLAQICAAYSAENASDDMRYWCVRIAGDLRAKESASFILKALDDPKWFVRSCACHSLSQFYDLQNEHIEKLFLLRYDKNSEVGKSAERALDAIGGERLMEASRTIVEGRVDNEPVISSMTEFWAARGEKLESKKGQLRRENLSKPSKKVAFKREEQPNVD
ncbi:MAG TPA: HEAT repeat domain-containing protein [Candidatus Wallbacteria bacterium]|nr:HEAT repeat domain-containing protein [Candidatus Wallbacteria bacterium]